MLYIKANKASSYPNTVCMHPKVSLQDLTYRVLSDEELKAESKRAELQRQLAAEALLKPKGEVSSRGFQTHAHTCMHAHMHACMHPAQPFQVSPRLSAAQAPLELYVHPNSRHVQRICAVPQEPETTGKVAFEVVDMRQWLPQTLSACMHACMHVAPNSCPCCCFQRRVHLRLLPRGPPAEASACRCPCVLWLSERQRR